MSTITVILSDSGSGTWTVPSDWNSSSNIVELLAAGGDGQVGPGGMIGSGGGGGGGLYTKYLNLSLTPGDIITYQVGAHGGGGGPPISPEGADTWFNTATTMFAMGGGNGPNALGGFQYAGSPSIVSSGGDSSSTADFVGCPGGGGAGGPNGPGGLGAGVELFPFNSGGGGGGGANGGADGQNSGDAGGNPGGHGGANRLGAGAGLGADGTVNPTPPPPALNGGNGSSGGGGGGGFGAGAANYSSGGSGSQDTLWDSYGPGGGGGGAGYSNASNGNGGNAGGRGGGGGGANTGGIAGLGTDGLIIITYTPIPGSRGPNGVVYNHLYYIPPHGYVPPTPPAPSAPTNTGLPVVNRAVVGEISNCSTGSWQGTLPMTFAYQWELDGSPIGGQITNSYTPVTGDLGHILSCTVTATNIVGAGTGSSNTGTVTDAGPILNIPDSTAFYNAVNAWPTTGNMTWVLGDADFGSLGLYGRAWESAPVTISGQSTLGQSRVSWIGLNDSSGFTFSGGFITVYGDDSGGFGVAIDVGNSDPSFHTVLTFNNLIVDSGTAVGTQAGGAYSFLNINSGSIVINGQNDATKIDIWGRSVVAGVNACSAPITIQYLTIANGGTDGIVAADPQNLTINANLFLDQYWAAGAHPNSIHFFPSSGATQVNNVISNNGIYTSIGQSQQGIFLESPSNLIVQDNWVFTSVFPNAFVNGGGTTLLFDKNFAQGVTGTGGGGSMVTRNGAINTTVTDNTCNTITNYSGSGVNPGYDPAVLPGTNTIIAAASSLTDFTELDTWLTSHPTARSRPA